MIDLGALLLSCAPLIAPDTARALIQVESSFNVYAIGVVGDSLVRQPNNAREAIATVVALDRQGLDYSLGLGQINKRNFRRLGLTAASAFDPCSNLKAMESILLDCFKRSPKRNGPQASLRDALSCYYSGNFTTGYAHGYVAKAVGAWSVARAPP